MAELQKAGAEPQVVIVADAGRTVLAVAVERETGPRKLNADLMMASGVKMDLQKGTAAAAIRDPGRARAACTAVSCACL